MSRSAIRTAVAFAAATVAAGAVRSAPPAAPSMPWRGPPNSVFTIPATNSPDDVTRALLPPDGQGLSANDASRSYGGAAATPRGLVLRSSGHQALINPIGYQFAFDDAYAAITWSGFGAPSRVHHEYTDPRFATTGFDRGFFVGADGRRDTYEAQHSYGSLVVQGVADGGAPHLVMFGTGGANVDFSGVRIDMTKPGRDAYDPQPFPRAGLAYSGYGYPTTAVGWPGHGVFFSSQSGRQGKPDAFLTWDGRRQIDVPVLVGDGTDGVALLDEQRSELITVLGGTTARWGKPMSSPNEVARIRCFDFSAGVDKPPVVRDVGIGERRAASERVEPGGDEAERARARARDRLWPHRRHQPEHVAAAPSRADAAARRPLRRRLDRDGGEARARRRGRPPRPEDDPAARGGRLELPEPRDVGRDRRRVPDRHRHGEPGAGLAAVVRDALRRERLCDAGARPTRPIPPHHRGSAMDAMLRFFGDGSDLAVHQMFLRGIAVFCIALLLVRLSGRRSFGLHSPFDACTTVLLGAILSRAVVGASPFWATTAAGVALAGMHRLVGFVAARSVRFERFISGRAIVLYADGRFDRAAMRRALVSEYDVRKAAREALQTDDLATVDRAILEHGGTINVVVRR